jgi:hypothetical protein
MSKYHYVKNLKFQNNQLTIEIDGKKEIFDLSDISKVLLNASDIERMTYEISPSGYGIHWPLIDEDISIDGLLGIIHTPDVKHLKAS